MKNNIDIFSNKIGNRHIGCNEKLTLEKIEQLVQLCSKNNIPYTTFNNDSPKVLYWVHNSTTEHCTEGLRVLTSEDHTGLMDWFWFMYLPWDLTIT